MPPPKNKAGAVRLNPAELARLAAWIDTGAKNSVKQSREVAWKPLPKGTRPIYAVALNADASLAACARGDRIFLHQPDSQAPPIELHDPKTNPAAIQSLAFSPDGHRLAAGSFRTVQIWNYEQPQPTVRSVEGLASDRVTAALPDASALLAITEAGALVLRDPLEGRIQRVLIEHLEPAAHLLAASPDGAWAAIGFEDGKVRITPLRGNGTDTFWENTPPLNALAWSRDNTQLAVAQEGQTLRVWPVTPQPAPAQPLIVKSPAPIRCLIAGSSTDQWITSCADNTVRILSSKPGTPARQLPAPGPGIVSLSPDGTRLAVACNDGALRILDLATSKSLLELRGDPDTFRKLSSLDWDASRAGLDVAFHKAQLAKLETETKDLDNLTKKTTDAMAAATKGLPDKEKALATATEARAQAEKTTTELAASTEDPAPLLQKRKDAASKLESTLTTEKSAEAALNAARNALRDGEENLRRAETARTRNAQSRKETEAAQNAAQQAQTAAANAAAQLRKELATASPKTPATPAPAATAASTTQPITALAFSGDTLAAVSAQGRVTLWNTASARCTASITAPTAAAHATLLHSSAQGWLAFTSAGERLNPQPPGKWHLERVLGSTSGNSPLTDRIAALCFSPDGNLLATGGGELSRSGDIHLWDPATGRLVQSWTERHRDAVLCLDFSPDGRWLASGGADKLARITEVASGRPVHTMEAHTHHVLSVSFRADARVLATAGADGSVNVWDTASGERRKKITTWEKEVTALQFIGATAQFLTTSGDQQARILNEDGTEARSLTKRSEFLHAAASARSGTLVAAGGETGLLRLWDPATGRELASHTTPTTPAK